MSHQISAAHAADRLALLERADLHPGVQVAAFERASRLAAFVLDVPISLVRMREEGHLFISSSLGEMPWSEEEAEQFPSFPCEEVVRTGCRVLLDDMRLVTDSDAARLLSERGVRGCVSIPLTTEEGLTIGTLCVMDRRARVWKEREVELLEDVAMLAVTEVELRLRRAALQENEAKSQFLAAMSHEIRTPLSAILGYVDLLEMRLAGPLTEKQSEYLGRVRSSGQHLLTLIGDVLDLAKIASGKLRVRRDRLSLRRIVKEAMKMVEPLLEAKQLHYAVESDVYPGVLCYGDSDRIRQVLVNLLSNAVKFTAGGEITVRCRVHARAVTGMEGLSNVTKDDPWVCIEVEDTGRGIPEEEKENIFEPFVQVNGVPEAKEGTGLGLPISRQLARLMGGDLRIEETSEEGSCFALWLQAVRPDPGRNPPRQLLRLS